MHIALLQVKLHIPACHSLKEKRSLIKRLISLVRARHNIAVAEIGDHDAWQSARLGLVTINNESGHTDRVLQRVIGEIGRFDGCELLDYQIERF